MSKYVFFAFKGEAMCFMHILLNALDMHSKDMDVKIVIEGEAVVLVKEMIESKNPLFKKVLDKKLFDCICKACSSKMGVLDYNLKCGIPINGDMSGHPPMSSYVKRGYNIITL